MASKANNGLAYRALEPPTTVSVPVSPQRTVASLAIPVGSPASRRPSPRVEDMLRGSPRKAQRTRQRLSNYHTLDDAVALLKSCNNIVVLTGAGISTSVGIPDFRSDKGLYNKLSKIGITQPEDFFSMSYFQENPEDFFKYVREVVPSAVPGLDGTYIQVKPSSKSKMVDSKTNVENVPRFTPTHAFLTLLQNKGKLLTNYTQNIDGLEHAAGLPKDRYIQCHGSWDTATCLTCAKSSSAKKYLPVVHSGNVPHCKCLNDVKVLPAKPKRKRSKSRVGQKRKRANSFSDHSSDDGTKPLEPPRGLLKPDLVFFEEKITPLYHTRLESDRPKLDLLIIIGTSLKVAPIQYMLFKINPNVPQIYISKERFNGALCSLPGVQVDIELLGECDIIIEELCRRAGWATTLAKWLWEEGQTKIKKADRHSIKQPALPKENAAENTKNTNTFSATPGKDSNVAFETEGGAKMPTTSISYSTIMSDVEPQSVSQTTSKLSEQILSSEGVVAKGEKKTFPSSAFANVPAPESRVKVELVEGTEHQWRITRKKP